MMSIVPCLPVTNVPPPSSQSQRYTHLFSSSCSHQRRRGCVSFFDMIIPVLLLSRSSSRLLLLLHLLLPAVCQICYVFIINLSACYLGSALLSFSRLSLSVCLSVIPLGSHAVLSCSSANLSPDLSYPLFIPPAHLFPTRFLSLTEEPV